MVSQAFDRFNRGFEWLSFGYGSLTRRLARAGAIVLVVYVGLIGTAGIEFARTPTGFIPEQDQGYLIRVVQLPPGATLDRTEKLVRRGIDVILGTTGIEHVAPFGGLDATTFTVAPNAATIFSGLPSLYEHELPGVISNTVLADLRKRLSVIKDGYVVTIPPPPVQGLGSGFKMMLEDRGGLGPQALEKAARALVAAPNKDPTFASVFTLFNAGSPSIYADIDRMKAEKLGLTPSDIFSTLQVYPRLTIRQRLQVSRPHLSGQGTERRAIQAHSAGHPPSQSPQRIRRDGADRGGSPAAEQDDPLSRAALQLVSGCRGARGSGAGRRHRHGVAAHGGAGERGASEGHCVRVDRLAFQQQLRGTPTLLVFGAARSLSSWFSSRDTKTRSCRWPSS